MGDQQLETSLRATRAALMAALQCADLALELLVVRPVPVAGPPAPSEPPPPPEVPGPVTFGSKGTAPEEQYPIIPPLS